MGPVSAYGYTMNTNTHRVIAVHYCQHLNNGLKGREGFDMHPEAPIRWEFASADFASREDAEALMATMPKALKAWVASCYHQHGVTTYSVHAKANLAADDVNGGVNETGVRRYWTLTRWAAKTSTPITFDGGYSEVVANAYQDRATFEAAITA